MPTGVDDASYDRQLYPIGDRDLWHDLEWVERRNQLRQQWYYLALPVFGNLVGLQQRDCAFNLYGSDCLIRFRNLGRPHEAMQLYRLDDCRKRCFLCQAQSVFGSDYRLSLDSERRQAMLISEQLGDLGRCNCCMFAANRIHRQPVCGGGASMSISGFWANGSQQLFARDQIGHGAVFRIGWSDLWLQWL